MSNGNARKRAKKREARAAKELQGYDEEMPPCCRNCIYKHDSAKNGPVCAVGEFPVQLHAICKHWTDKHGATLE